MLTARRFFSVIWDYGIVTVGTILYCMGWTSFLIPNGIASGGGTGLCTIIYFATGIPVSYSFFVLNAILLIAGFLALGKGFGFKTIYACIMLSVFVAMWTGIIGNFPLLADDKLLSAVIGGALIGLSIGISFNYGGSTGGTDIIALIVSKFYNISPGRVILLCDIFIISSSFLVFHVFNGHPVDESIRVVLYGFVVMAVTSYTIDLIVLGSRASVQILVNSTKYREIADMIVDEKKRGVTLLHAEGYYSKQESQVLLLVVRKYELQSILRRIKDIDPNAFMSITNATGVYGKGFDNIK